MLVVGNKGKPVARDTGLDALAVRFDDDGISDRVFVLVMARGKMQECTVRSAHLG
ncbi:hypothetical protein D3C87_1593630 [compost metagenome]